MKEQLIKFCKFFKKLKVDKTHVKTLGVAPHKPILLLSVLQGIQNGLITSNEILISPELVGLFKANWSLLVDTGHSCRISYPFYYMKSEPFWNLVPKGGVIDINQKGKVFSSLSSLSNVIECATIDNELFVLALDPISNGVLTSILLDEYFLHTKLKFQDSNLIQRKIFGEIEGKILHEDPIEYRKEIEELIAEKNDEEIFLRGGIFKREIPKIYNSTCCISGMKVDAIANVSMIDACHIIPFSESYNDTITNGIALCPNLHRAFDRGLIGVNDEYRVIVSDRFTESDQSSYQIRIYNGKTLKLPSDGLFYPSKDNFAWHRKKWQFDVEIK